MKVLLHSTHCIYRRGLEFLTFDIVWT